jgi:hypothetical protein
VTPADYLAWVLLLMGAAILIACSLIGAARFVLDRFRAHDDDWPADVPPELLGWPTDTTHHCPVCFDLAADDANGILRTDFELWAAEMAEPGRRD